MLCFGAYRSFDQDKINWNPLSNKEKFREENFLFNKNLPQIDYGKRLDTSRLTRIFKNSDKT